MNYEMFLPGDADFVISVLQSISAIMATGYIGTGAAFGAVLALLLAGIKQLTSGTAISWRTTLVTVGMFHAFFGTTQQVLVQDMLTGEADVVTEIPTGVALTGTIVTKTGWSVAELMEQGFSVPGMTQTGLFRDLDTMRRVRAMPYLVPNGGIADSTGSASVSATQSWSNYYKACIWPYAVQENNSELRNRVRNNDSLLDALSSDLANNLVLLSLPSVQGSYSCADAYTELKRFTEIDFFQTYLEANAQRFGLESGATAAEVQARIQASIDNLQGWNLGTQGLAKDLVLNTVLYDMILKSYQEDTIAAVNDPWSTMLDDARRQRAVQWSGEADMWTAVMPAASSFFIGLVYALTPLIAILIVMGDFGIGLVTKYISVLLWVMLWPVVMSIVNQYGLITTSTEFSGVIENTGSMTSVSALDQIDAVLIEKLALLDKLVASSAVIALFLATGSMYALTQLTSAFSSSDHVDEKKIAPDSYSSPAMAQADPMMSFGPTYGYRETGLENVAESYNLSSALSNATQAKISQAEAAQQSYSTQMSQTYRMATQGSDVFALGENFAQSFSTSSSEVETWSQTKASQLSQGLGLSEKEENQLAGAIAAKGMAGLGMPGASPLKLAGEINLSGARSFTEAQALTEELNARIAEDYQDGQQWANEFREASTADLSAGNTDTLSSVVGNEKAESLSQAASYATTQSAEASEAQGLANSFGRSQTVSSLAIAETLRNNPQANEQLSQLALEQGVYEAALNRSSQYEAEYGGADRALSASLVGELFNKFRDNNDVAGFRSLIQTLGPAIGMAPHSMETPTTSVDDTPREQVQEVGQSSIQSKVNSNIADKRETQILMEERLNSPEGHIKDLHAATSVGFDNMREDRLSQANIGVRQREAEIREEHQEASPPEAITNMFDHISAGDYSGAARNILDIEAEQGGHSPASEPGNRKQRGIEEP